jgi:hypothetical protein
MAGLEVVSVATFNTLVGKSEGRDKLARFVQYMARAFIGFAGMTALKKGTRLYELNEQAANIMKQLAGARRTHRWCKEFPVIKSIIQGGIPAQISAPTNLSAFLEKSMDLLQKCTLATFLVIDHVGWLKQVKVLSGGKRAGTGTIQLGLKFFCASNLLGALMQLKKAGDAQAQAKDAKDDGKAANKECAKCTQNAFKHALLVLQTAHLSRLRESHDALVGVAGMVTSAMDVLAQWPERKAQEAKGEAKALADLKAGPDVTAVADDKILAKPNDQKLPKSRSRGNIEVDSKTN